MAHRDGYHGGHRVRSQSPAPRPGHGPPPSYGGGRPTGAPPARGGGGGGGRSSASDKALIIRGCSGRYQLINGTYEPRGSHNNFPCWTSVESPTCIFHTGKTRWVVSKERDDGLACYAFIQDDGSETPAQCQGRWTRFNQEAGEWQEDPNIKCSEASISQDPFVAVRFALEDEMSKVRISEEADRQKMWKKIDRNGDGNVDLGEIEALVGDLAKSGVWPNWLNNEQSLQRAYKKTLEESIDGDDKVEKEEFHALLLNIFWFGKLHDLFDEIDTGDDDTVNIDEFQQGMNKLGIRLSPQSVHAEFQSIDQDGSGVVDFDEFCLYVRKRIQSDTSDGKDGAHQKVVQAHQQIRLGCGNTATSGSMVRKKNFADFDKLEKQIKDICSEPSNKGLNRLWRKLDFNGNNLVSLAEIDKWVVEQYPLLNHKPALIRAQQATLQAGNGDDWVQKKEFKSLLVNLFYYNKLFWLFDQADEGKDRRMDFKEFQFCLSMCGVKLSPTKAKTEFDKIDSNGGGQVLFDEFCQYFVSKKCPEGMTAFIADQ